MKWRFAWCYRLGLAVLLVVAFWALWANAQSATNPPANDPSLASAQPAPPKAQLSEHALTFGLDRINFLREQVVLEQPLWKYLASLIYIALAFCVAWLMDLFVSVWLKKLAARTDTKYDDLILELLRGPVKAESIMSDSHGNY